MNADLRVLVVEDGDEYLTNLTTFVSGGIRYTQAKSGEQACALLAGCGRISSTSTCASIAPRRRRCSATSSP
jgi:hypothetical protein